MELVKDVLKVEELKGYQETQTLIETEIYLNQLKPDIEKLLWTDGKVEILNTKIIRDKIITNGIVRFKSVYKSKEEEVNIYTLETTADFRQEIEIEGITEEMAAEVKANLEYIDEEIKDERKVSLKAVVNLIGKVEQTNTIEIIKEIKEGLNLQVLREKIKYKDVYGKEDSYALVKEAFEVEEYMPPIEDILKVSIHAYEKESTLVEDRIIVSGVVEASIIYYGENRLNSVKKELPFNHFLDMPGALRESECQVDMEVVDGEYEIRENMNGDYKVLDLESKIRITGKVYEEKEKEVIVDAYSTKKKINLEKEEIKVIENIKDITHREKVEKDLNGKAIKEVYGIDGTPIILDSRYLEEKIVVEGILSLNLFYLEEGTEEISTLKEEVPFKSYISTEELKQNIAINVEASLETLDYSLKNDNLSIDASIKNRVLVNREKKTNIINKIEETDEIIDKKNRPSITVYIVQKGDVLWDIAKRYNTTVEEIVLSNNINNPSILMPGEKIIIEKNVDFAF